MAHHLGTNELLEKDESAREVMSAWILGSGKLLIIHAPQAFTDARVWGILLADLARHVSDAHRKLDGSYPLEAIVEMFNAEITNPTTEYEGRVERKQ